MSAVHNQCFGRSVTNPARGIDLLARVIPFPRDGGAFTCVPMRYALPRQRWEVFQCERNPL
jgi:hypothetical protein